MLEDLFIPDATVNPSASEIELSENMDQWPMEIQSILVSHIPVLADVQGQLFMDAVNEDKLYAKGSYVVTGDDGSNITFPIVIRSGKMFPPDLYIQDGNWRPVDAQDIVNAISSPDIGIDLVDEKDIPPTAASGMTTKVNPPGSYGTGTGIVSTLANKVASQQPEVTQMLLETIENNKEILSMLKKNAAARTAMLNMLDKPYKETITMSQELEKHANANPFAGSDAVITSVGRGKFVVKYAKRGSLNIEESVFNGNELAGLMKAAGVNSKRILDELVQRKIATTWEEGEDLQLKKFASVTSPGLAVESFTSSDFEKVGSLILGVIKESGKRLALHGNGSYSVQDSVYGRELGDGTNVQLNYKTAEDIAAGDTIAVPISKTGEVLNFIDPILVEKVAVQGTDKICIGRVGNKSVTVVATSTKIAAPVRAKYVPETLMAPKSNETWYVPATSKVISLPPKVASVVADHKEATSTAAFSAMRNGKKLPFTSAKMWKLGSGASSVAVKFAAKEPRLISDAEALIYLRKSGEAKPLEELVKMAAGIVKSIDLVGAIGQDVDVKKKVEDKETLKRVKDLKEKISAVSTLKIAALLEDEEDVDSVLSLNYLTPENLGEFKAAVPKLKDTEQMLSKLLMSTRLGNSVVGEQDVKTTLRTLHEIIKELDGSL